MRAAQTYALSNGLGIKTESVTASLPSLVDHNHLPVEAGREATQKVNALQQQLNAALIVVTAWYIAPQLGIGSIQIGGTRNSTQEKLGLYVQMIHPLKLYNARFVI